MTDKPKKWTDEIVRISPEKLEKLDKAFEQAQTAMVDVLKARIDIGFVNSEANKMIDKIDITKDFIEGNVIREGSLPALTINFKDDLNKFAKFTSELLQSNQLDAHQDLMNSVESAAETFNEFRLELSQRKSL